MTERYQAVWIDHKLSNFLKCDIGVPQGSNLGPLFFSIFFSDLLYSLDCEVENYADDTTLVAAGDTVENVSIDLETNCLEVTKWMRSNMLKLNADKTHILTVASGERLQRLQSRLHITMDNSNLQEGSDKKELLLGCTFQANLKWHSHITQLKSKLSSRLAALSCIKYSASFAVKKNVAEGIFISILTYCISLFGGTESSCLKELQILQNKAAQIVCRAPPRSNRVLLFEKVKWLTLNQLVAYQTLVNVYKIRKNSEAEYLSDLLNRDSRG